MRINFFLLLLSTVLALILWVTLSGALAVIAGLILAFFIMVVLFYADKSVLFFLGAREVKSTAAVDFSQAAVQQAYKLGVPVPGLYFYDGAFERAFILENRRSLSLVLSKQVLSSSNPEDLEAICFELLIQARDGLASKRTRLMFMVGFFSWLTHSILRIVLRPFRSRDASVAGNLVVNYFLYPWTDLLFRLCLGKGYYKRLQNSLKAYPREWELLKRVGLKLNGGEILGSLPSRKLMEYSASGRSTQLQNILAIEVLPHEWDFIFKGNVGAQ